MPSNMRDMRDMRVLLLENIHSDVAQCFREAQYKVDIHSGAMEEGDLNKKIPSYAVLGIRSRTCVHSQAMDLAPRLLAIGVFCIGTDQVDLLAAQERGLPVFNAPHGSTRSVAEMVLAQLICLSRQLYLRHQMCHQGHWMKSAEGARQLKEKRLGIIGYGNIGTQVGLLAEALGMLVSFYDIAKKLPLGGAVAVHSLPKLLSLADFVTLHVPETTLTRGMICSKTLAQMKKGAYLVNASRGNVVREKDLLQSLQSGHLAGVALDVFEKEPQGGKGSSFSSPFQGMDQVVLTPHIGGSTEEAQKVIGEELCLSLLGYLQRGEMIGSVNFPSVSLPPLKGVPCRVIHIHQNQPGILSQVNQRIAQQGANIQFQHLATQGQIGYLAMDISEPVPQDLLQFEGTLRIRLIQP